MEKETRLEAQEAEKHRTEIKNKSKNNDLWSLVYGVLLILYSMYTGILIGLYIGYKHL